MLLALRRLLIAIVALAILAAPCLSALTPIGGLADARYMVSTATAHHAGDHERYHGASHHLAGAQQQTPAPVTPSHEPVDCCCECDGWIAAKAPIVPAAYAAKPKADNPALTSSPLALELAVVTVGRSTTVHEVWPDPPGRDPVYAMTGRLRI